MQKTVISYLIILMALVLSKSMLSRYLGDDTLLLMFFFMSICISFIYKIKIKKVIFVKTLVLIFVFTSVVFINDSSITRAGGVIIVILCGLIISNFIRLNDFENIYLRIVYVLSIVSLFSWVLVNVLNPSLFPSLNIEGTDFRLVGINFYDFNELRYSKYNFFGIEIFRNNSIFWEGGAYQFFLNLAIFLKIKNKSFSFGELQSRLLIFSVITCLSLVGYLALTLNIYYYNKSFAFKATKKYLVGTFSILFIALILLNTDLITKGMDYIHLFYNMGSQTSQVVNISAAARFTDVYIDLMIFFDNPLFGFGLGNNEVRELASVNSSIIQVMGGSSNSITYLLSSMGGIIFGFFIIIIYRLKLTNNNHDALFLLINLFFQNIIFTSIVMLYIFYGHINYENEFKHYIASKIKK